MLKHGYHKIKETAILLAIPIDLLFDSQINFFWRLFSDCDIFSGLLWTRGEGQHILQIFVDPETVCFCSLYQAVYDGTGFCSADGIHVDPVLTPKGERTDGTFRCLSSYKDNLASVPSVVSASERRTGKSLIP